MARERARKGTIHDFRITHSAKRARRIGGLAISPSSASISNLVPHNMLASLPEFGLDPEYHGSNAIVGGGNRIHLGGFKAIYRPRARGLDAELSCPWMTRMVFNVARSPHPYPNDIATTATWRNDIAKREMIKWRDRGEDESKIKTRDKRKNANTFEWD